MIKLRRTMLFVPGNNPGMLQNAGVFGADSVILDLEDAVSPAEKDAARLLVANALRHVDYGASERVVRINPLDSFAKADIEAIVPCMPDVLLIPKVQAPNDVREIAELVEKAEAGSGMQVKLIALLETPSGIAEAYQIGKSHPRLVGLALGAEDYTAALGAKRTPEGTEIYMARSMVVNAAAAAGIHSLDTPFTDANDEAGLLRDTAFAKQIGFKGKLAINPRQIESIHSIFNPTTQDILWAERVLAAIKRAEAEGSGVASLDGKMVDAPIVNRAEQVLYLAELLGLAEEAAE